MKRDSISVSRRPSSTSRGHCRVGMLRKEHSFQTSSQRPDPRRHDRIQARNHRSVIARFPSKEVCPRGRSRVSRSSIKSIRLGWCTLQRLFSTFPNSWPGIGLLLLRLCLGITLIHFGTAGLSGKPSEPITLIENVIAGAGGIFLLAGLWTPAVGGLIALDEVWIGLSLYAANREDLWLHVRLAIFAVSVAMLGPGAWSIDARLFGRKRFDIDWTRGSRPSP